MTLENGYKMTTTFWEDFTIADMFGKEAIRDTFKRAFREWKNDYVYLTELVIVLNHKILQHYIHRDGYSGLYNELWLEADRYACDNLKGEEYDFYRRVTD
jgi:hypothetical protein